MSENPTSQEQAKSEGQNQSPQTSASEQTPMKRKLSGEGHKQEVKKFAAQMDETIADKAIEQLVNVRFEQLEMLKEIKSVLVNLSLNIERIVVSVEAIKTAKQAAFNNSLN